MPAGVTLASPAASAVSTTSTALVASASSQSTAAFNLAQTLSDQAQRTTLAFDGLAMVTGNLNAQSFFPPGKVADYFGFQYLRDNDPDNMGHNTSFLTRIANNVIYILNSTQLAKLAAVKGQGFNSWSNITNAQIQSKAQSLPQGTLQDVMTYAGDIFSWYAGSVDADVYFCPERHGTYFGGFYIKDAPAVGHEGYSISEQLTATAGAALCDASKGYVTQVQATLVSSLVDLQRNNLYAGTTNIVQTRTQIATLLRSLRTSTASAASVKTQVLALSTTYGTLDGENNCHYATVFAKFASTLTTDQKTKLTALRKSLMSGTYSNGTSFDYSTCTTPFLYSTVIKDTSVLAPYVNNTDSLFLKASSLVPSVTKLSVTTGPTAGGTTITITGTNLAGATVVCFGKTAVTKFTSRTATQIVLASPTGTAGTVDVTVVAPTGTSAISSADKFTYTVSRTVIGGKSLLASAAGSTALLGTPRLVDAALVSLSKDSESDSWQRSPVHDNDLGSCLHAHEFVRSFGRSGYTRGTVPGKGKAHETLEDTPDFACRGCGRIAGNGPTARESGEWPRRPTGTA